jgi:ATP-dependent RNA helicase RhlE
LDLIEKAGYGAPTPVQEQCIPVALEGHDLIGTAQTGTGKTATFTLPMVERFAGRRGTFGLVLAPTREIAQQTQATFEKFGAPRGVTSIVLIGGVNMRDDDKALATYPQVIVATPGRLCDHLDRGNIWLDFIEMVVLDEADRMLDMGFTDQLSRIMQDVPATRQTLLFSATMTPSVEKLARKIMKDPQRVAIGAPQSTATSVEQFIRHIPEERKNSELRKIIREEPGSIIVFTRSKIGATKVWRSLHSSGVYDATYIHSDRLQSHREQALAEFKEGKYRILIATDVAGRGIHVEGVAHVVNYDLPMEPEDYVHRIGRTGRAGATGRATTFVTPRDRGLLREIEKLIGRSLQDAPLETSSAATSSERHDARPAAQSASPVDSALSNESSSVNPSPDHGEPSFPQVKFQIIRTSEVARPSLGEGDAPAVASSIAEEREPVVDSSLAMAAPSNDSQETHEGDASSDSESDADEGGSKGRRRQRWGRDRDQEHRSDSESLSANDGARRQKTFFPIDEPPPPPLSARGLYAGTSTPWSVKSATPWREEGREEGGEQDGAAPFTVQNFGGSAPGGGTGGRRRRNRNRRGGNRPNRPAESSSGSSSSPSN